MVRIGVHVSIAGSIDKAVDRAQEKGCDTFQIFSRNPRGWKIRTLSEAEINRFIEKVEHSGIFPPVDHMPYLPNLAAPTDEVYEKSVATLGTELKRCNALKIPYLVTHLGSHRGYGKELGLQRIVDAINTVFRDVAVDESNSVMLLLENTASTKNSMGGTFEDIRRIVDRIEHKERIGICFDTCHAFAAGYELRTEKSMNATLQHFDEVLGLENLKLVHLNDAKGGLDSRLDRHEHIGLGYIGEDGFRVILNDARLKEIPMILETPVDNRRGDSENLQTVRELAGPL